MLALADAVYVSLIVAVSAIASPIIATYFTNRTRRRERKEDWDRQDRVAALVKEQGDSQGRKLDKVVTLSDGALTAAKRGELVARQAVMVLLEERAGREGATQEEKARANAERQEIEKLRIELEEREKSLKQADAEAKTAREPRP